jgi:hypothetical protein
MTMLYVCAGCSCQCCMSLLHFHAVCPCCIPIYMLHVISCPISPVLLSGSPVRTACPDSLFHVILSWPSPDSPFLPLLFCLSSFCLSCSAYPGLALLFCLSSSACLFLLVPYCLSGSAFPVCLSYSACHIPPVLFCLSCFTGPVLPFLFWMSCSA